MTPRRQPLLTLVLLGAALALLASPRAADALAFERARLAAQPWRFLTGHLVHAPGLARVDLVVLVALGAWWELRSRRACAGILVASGSLASLALLLCTSFASYTGSSALGSGLFAAAALEIALRERGRRRWLGAGALALFAAKCALEGAGHSALFVALPPGTEVAVAAHAAGGLGGALVVLLRRRLEPELHRKRPVDER